MRRVEVGKAPCAVEHMFAVSHNVISAVQLHAGEVHALSRALGGRGTAFAFLESFCESLELMTNSFNHAIMIPIPRHVKAREPFDEECR